MQAREPAETSRQARAWGVETLEAFEKLGGSFRVRALGGKDHMDGPRASSDQETVSYTVRVTNSVSTIATLSESRVSAIADTSRIESGDTSLCNIGDKACERGKRQANPNGFACTQDTADAYSGIKSLSSCLQRD